MLPVNRDAGPTHVPLKSVASTALPSLCCSNWALYGLCGPPHLPGEMLAHSLGLGWACGCAWLAHMVAICFYPHPTHSHTTMPPTPRHIKNQNVEMLCCPQTNHKRCKVCDSEKNLISFCVLAKQNEKPI